MAGRVTIREAAEILGLSSDTIRRRVRAGTLNGEREETPQGFVWYVEVPDSAAPVRMPMQPPMHDGVTDALAALQQQLAIKDEQLATQARMMEAMREERAREVEQLHVLLQTAQQNEQRLLSATIPDAPHAPERPADDGSGATSGITPHSAPQREPAALQRPPRRSSWWSRLFGLE